MARHRSPISAHVPRWRLSRLQNLAISPLATILLFGKQPRSERGWGLTEHHGDSHRLWLRRRQNRLFTADACACLARASLLTAPTHGRLRLQPQTGRRGGKPKRRPDGHPGNQAPHLPTRGPEGLRWQWEKGKAPAAIHYNPKARGRPEENFQDVSYYIQDGQTTGSYRELYSLSCDKV